MRSIVSRLWFVAFALLLAGLGNTGAASFGSEIIVSVPDQEFALVSRGKVVGRYSRAYLPPQRLDPAS